MSAEDKATNQEQTVDGAQGCSCPAPCSATPTALEYRIAAKVLRAVYRDLDKEFDALPCWDRWRYTNPAIEILRVSSLLDNEADKMNCESPNDELSHRRPERSASPEDAIGGCEQ